MGGSGIEHDEEHGIRWKYVEMDQDDPEKDKRQPVFPLLVVFVHYPICLSLFSVTYIWAKSVFPLLFVTYFLPDNISPANFPKPKKSIMILTC